MHKNHILIVANTAWSVFNFRHGLLNRLLSDGYHVSVVAPNDKFSGKLNDMGCDVIDLPMSAKGVNPFDDIKLGKVRTSIPRTKNENFSHLISMGYQ